MKGIWDLDVSHKAVEEMLEQGEAFRKNGNLPLAQHYYLKAEKRLCDLLNHISETIDDYMEETGE